VLTQKNVLRIGEIKSILNLISFCENGAGPTKQSKTTGTYLLK